MEVNTMKLQLEFAQLKNTSLSPEAQDQLVVFLLVFNVFEARLFKNGKGVSNLLKKISEDVVKERWFCDEIFKEYLIFFKERYVVEENVNKAFYLLRLSGEKNNVSNDKGNAMAVILGQEKGSGNVLRCCLCIAYRFRNNLFHGEKEVLGLDAYYDCFDKIVKFIVLLLEKMIDNDFKGLKDKY